MDFRVLGPVEVYFRGSRLDIGRRRERGLLGLLLLEANRFISNDQLTSLLWTSQAPVNARRYLAVHASRLRSRLAGAVSLGVNIEGRSDGYRIEVSPELVDVHRFRHAVALAHRISAPAQRVRTLESALQLWRGPLMADSLDLEARERIGASLAEAQVQAREMLLEARLADAGPADALLPDLVQLAGEYPLRERGHRMLMQALLNSGRVAEALQHYLEMRRLWIDELGMEPGPELQAVHQKILNADRVVVSAPPAAQPPPVARHRVVPAQLPPDAPVFAGRAEHLRRLNGLLPSEPGQTLRAVVISAINGTAGVGKTALAVRWGRRVADWFPDGQLYLNLRGFDPSAYPTSPGEAVRSLLEALEVPAAQIPVDLQARVGLYRSLLINRRVFLLFDNALSVEQVRPLLPGSPGSLVVITSRNRMDGLVATDGAEVINVDVLTESESRELLTERLGAQRVAAEPEAVRTLIARCGGLPLALVVIAAQAILQPARPLADLAREISADTGALDLLAGGDDRLVDVRAVFSWSYHMLSPSAARLFRLLGWAPGADFSARAVAALLGAQAPEPQQALEELTRAHLIVRRSPDRFSMHDLLRVYARELAAPGSGEAETDQALNRLLDHYVHSAHNAAMALRPQRDPLPVSAPVEGAAPVAFNGVEQARDWFGAEHQVLADAVRMAFERGDDTRVEALAWALTTFLYRIGRWDDQLDIQRLALEAGRRAADPARQCRAHRALANTHRRRAEYPQALAEHANALEMYRLLDDPIGEAHTRMDMSLVLEKLGDLAAALDQVERAHQSFEAAGHRSGQANALNAIGWFTALMGKPEAGIGPCTRALAMLTEIEDLAGQAGTLDSLGYIHRRAGQFEEAAQSYRRAAELCRHLGDQLHEADALNNLGDTYLEAGLPQRAGQAWEAALAILNELGHEMGQSVQTKLAALPL
ncbi:MAG TPA: BTAD domain-containing putative transcriptional regulator [Candidatus Limnocylindrales bacterium]